MTIAARHREPQVVNAQERGPDEMFRLVSEHVFPFLRSLAADGSTYGAQMKDATFAIPNAALLTKIVDLLDSIDLDNRDTKGDLCEYLLSEIDSRTASSARPATSSS